MSTVLAVKIKAIVVDSIVNGWSDWTEEKIDLIFYVCLGRNLLRSVLEIIEWTLTAVKCE
jgi:hypothetical protein